MLGDRITIIEVKILKIVLLVLLLTGLYSVANAVTVTPVTNAGSTPVLSNKLGTIYSEQQIKELVDIYSTKYGVNSTRVLETIRCESRFNNVQSAIVSKGVREDSWGIAQIHLPSHPNISKYKALDPNFAIEWTVKEFSVGHASKWSCYKKIYQS